MIEYNDVSTIKKVPFTFTCDKCGKKYKYGVDDFEMQEFRHINFIGGYASVFGDETEVNYDVCQHCLYTFIKGENKNG